MNVMEFADEYEKVLNAFLKKYPEKADLDEAKDGREIISRIKNDPTALFRELSKAKERTAKRLFKVLNK